MSPYIRWPEARMRFGTMKLIGDGAAAKHSRSVRIGVENGRTKLAPTRYVNYLAHDDPGDQAAVAYGPNTRGFEN